MNPIIFALRRPITIMVMMVALLGGGILALFRTKIDIFPSLNLPVVYVCQPFPGMDPGQMEGLIANYYEYHFLYIGGVHHVESKNVQGMAMMKIYFHPGTDMAQAIAETIASVNRSRAFMPPGTVPPFVMRFDNGSVPVGYLVLSSETKTVGQIQDLALFRVRPMFAAIAGVSAPPPFGGAQRTIVIRVDPERLKAYDLSADAVVQALAAGNAVAPSGVMRTEELMPFVPTNTMVVLPAELGSIPVGPPEQRIFLRHLGVIEDASDIATGYALVNGKRAVYIPVTKRADASTLDVVNALRANLPKMQEALPDDIRVSFKLDQSPYVTSAVENVAIESVLGAMLIGLMVLCFLRDWRSVLVVVLNIPLALAGSLMVLSLTGNTINLMTLGGLALAVGILVDEATVEVENIHTQMRFTPSVALAVRRGNTETAVPRLLAMLCILAMFIPALLMQGAARALFLPLSLAVGFAMITSYLLSSTLVPVLSVWLLRHPKLVEHARQDGEMPNSAFGRRLWEQLHQGIRWRWLLVPVYLLVAIGGVAWLAPRTGTDIFPQVDTGQFQFRLRAAAGTRIEETEALTQETLRLIGEEVGGADKIAMSLGYVGAIQGSYPIQGVFLWMSGPEEAIIRVQLKPDAPPVSELKRRLREKVPDQLGRWLEARRREQGVPEARITQSVRDLRLSFEPSDIVNEVMSFGSPTPVELQISGPNLAANRAFAEKIAAELKTIPGLVDLQFGQSLDYPTIEVNIQREKAAISNIRAEDVAKALAPATWSSRFTAPNYWRDPKSGIGYQVQVEIPTKQLTRAEDLNSLPVNRAGEPVRLLGDVADIRAGTMPGEYDRYNMRRLISLTANIAGQDLGTIATAVAEALERVGKAPDGIQVAVRGQIAPMEELLQGLRIGLLAAVVAMFLLLLAYFQSVRLALTAVAAVPAVLLGVVMMLLITGSTLNIQSYMGAIMTIGVATANGILLVTFADRYHREGATPGMAAARAARSRMRAILMTSLAMMVGMIPMALGVGQNGDQMAPLGRAVIGGLLAATVTTLGVLPMVFTLLGGRGATQSVSLDPSDPESRHYVSTEEAQA